jgi:hypothetical protein
MKFDSIYAILYKGSVIGFTKSVLDACDVIDRLVDPWAKEEDFDIRLVTSKHKELFPV